MDERATGREVARREGEGRKEVQGTRKRKKGTIAEAEKSIIDDIAER